MLYSFKSFVLCCIAYLLSFEGFAQYQLFVFEGSDWCASCRKLEKNVLSDSTFKAFLQEKQIEIVKVDFPQKKKLPLDTQKRNEALASQYNFTGEFPMLVLAKKETASYQRFTVAMPTIANMKESLETYLKHLP